MKDPVCDEFYHDTWLKHAKRNMEIYDEVCIQHNILDAVRYCNFSIAKFNNDEAISIVIRQ